MTIPNSPDAIKKLEELAARNIANGDWGDEVSLPWEVVPITPEEREGKNFVSHILPKVRGRRLPAKVTVLDEKEVQDE